MPPYNTDDLISEVLANLAAQRQSPPEQSVLGARMTLNNPQNQPDPMTDATLEGLRQNGGNIPILNGLERQYASKLLGQKIAYDAAQNDAQRQAASMGANMLRQAAQGAGMDLSGYGSDVSLQDAMQNLQTNDARALVEMFQGKYSKSSDQFFNDKWNELIKSGMPVGRAQRAAGELARQYQGERVSYLNGMLHGYGFDGRVVTPVGQQIVGQLAAESPQLANMYLNANPGQKDAYNTDNQMALAALQNQGIMDRLDKQIAGNLAYLVQSGQQALEQQNNQGQINRDNATHQSNLTEQRDINQQQRYLDFVKQNAFAVHSTVKEILGDNAADLAVASMFKILNNTSGKSGSGNATDDKSFKNYIDTLDKAQNRLIEQRNSIVNQYKDNLAVMPPEVQDQIAKIDARLEVIQNAIFGVSGVAPDYPAYTGDEKQDLQIIASIIGTQKQYNPKITDEEIFNFIRQWVHETDTGITDHYIQSLIKKTGR